MVPVRLRSGGLLPSPTLKLISHKSLSSTLSTIFCNKYDIASNFLNNIFSCWDNISSLWVWCIFMVYPKQSSFLGCLWRLSPSSKMDIKSFVNGIQRWDAPLVVSVPQICCLGVGTTKGILCILNHWGSNFPSLDFQHHQRSKWQSEVTGPIYWLWEQYPGCPHQVVSIHQPHLCPELFSLTYLFFSWSSFYTALPKEFARWLEVTQQLDAQMLTKFQTYLFLLQS